MPHPLHPVPGRAVAAAGDHHGSTPNHISFFMRERNGYSSKIGEGYAVNDAVQFNIAFNFRTAGRNRSPTTVWLMRRMTLTASASVPGKNSNG